MSEPSVKTYPSREEISSLGEKALVDFRFALIEADVCPDCLGAMTFDGHCMYCPYSDSESGREDYDEEMEWFV